MSPTAQRFLDVLSRMSTAVWALGLLALASVVGTFVLQLATTEVLVARYGLFLATVFRFLQLDQVYSAWWFLALAAFLVVSVSVCLTRNGPRLWRQLRPTKTPAALGQLRHWPVVVQTTLGPKQIGHRLKSAGFKPKRHYADGSSYWVQGAWGRWGYFLTHGAVVLLSLGAILTGVFGYRLTLHLVEGQTYGYAALWEDGAFKPVNLPFKLRNDAINVEHYFTGMPRQFLTNLTLINSDGAEQQVNLSVNKPLSHQGYRVYQADYGDGGSQVAFKARRVDGVTLLSGPFKGRTGFGEQVANGDDVLGLVPHKLQPVTVLDGFSTDPSKKQSPENMGPSVSVVVTSPVAGPIGLQLFKERPWFLGVRTQGENDAAIDENLTQAFQVIFLGLDPTKDEGWPLVAALLEGLPPPKNQGQGAQTLMMEKLTEIGGVYLAGLDEGVRLRIGLGAVTAATALYTLSLPYVPVLTEAKFKPYSGVIIAKDPGVYLFIWGGIFLVLGAGLMVYAPLVRLWVRQDPANHVTLVAAYANKKGALPRLKTMLSVQEQSKK